MDNLKIERHEWQPSWPNEIHITDKRRQECFTIYFKQNSDVEIEFEWDHGYGGRGSESMSIPIELLKNIIKEIEK